MAVVINEMEVAPQPAPQETAGQQGQNAGDSGGKDPMKLMEKKLYMNRARSHRLEAY
jgi:hypothetical protein